MKQPEQKKEQDFGAASAFPWDMTDIMRFDQADDDLFGRSPEPDSMKVIGGPEYGDGNNAKKSKTKPDESVVPYLPPRMVHKKPRAVETQKAEQMLVGQVPHLPYVTEKLSKPQAYVQRPRPKSTDQISHLPTIPHHSQTAQKFSKPEMKV